MTEPVDENTLAGRARRYARVTASVGGLAARLAGERFFGVAIDRQRHAADLGRALGGLKGPLMKVAQLLSTIPDALPEEYVRELTQLQSQAPSMGWPFVRRRMAAELGPNWEKRFRSFEREAAAAASLGQVHRAQTPDGERLACKLQYPDMDSAVEADLQQLKLAFAIFERYDRAVSTSQIHAEISARLREELDYAREASHVRLYGLIHRGEKGVNVPSVRQELSTRRLLTMTWLDGERLTDFVKSHPKRANVVAYNMFRAWYLPFYDCGVIHGDPHLGNYAACSDGSVNLLDFGCVRVFKPSFVRGVIDLYNALNTNDSKLAVHAYETWGFKNLSKDVIAVLNHWAEFVYAPLMEDKARRIQDTTDGVYGAEVAGKVHAELRRLGGVTPPREFVLMDRAAIGLGSVFLHLKAEINWYRLFHDLIGDFNEDTLGRRQSEALSACGVPPAN